jgi:hypothetical protein
MTPKEKVEEAINALGIYNAIYLAEEILTVLEDYEEVNNNIHEWQEVLDLLRSKL